MFESNMLNQEVTLSPPSPGIWKIAYNCHNEQPTHSASGLIFFGQERGENEATKNIAASSEAEIYQVLFYPGSLPAVT